jgi:hypothetical protein
VTQLGNAAKYLILLSAKLVSSTEVGNVQSGIKNFGVIRPSVVVVAERGGTRNCPPAGHGNPGTAAGSAETVECAGGGGGMAGLSSTGHPKANRKASTEEGRGQSAVVQIQRTTAAICPCAAAESQQRKAEGEAERRRRAQMRKRWPTVMRAKGTNKLSSVSSSPIQIVASFDSAQQTAINHGMGITSSARRRLSAHGERNCWELVMAFGRERLIPLSSVG